MTKRWWQSRTILGALAALLATAVRTFWPDSAVDESQLLDLLLQGTQFAGMVLAIVGRVQAKTRVVSKKQATELRRVHDELHRKTEAADAKRRAERGDLPRADEPRSGSA